MERILLYSARFFTEMTSVRLALDGEDIPYYIEDEHANSIGYLGISVGIKLYVDKHHFEPAVKALLRNDVITDSEANEALGFGSE
ncbi:MAG: hypothetical protein AAF193_02620 [Bacteroidota bacterium]